MTTNARATLITGATGGLGRALAVELAGRGHRLALHGRDQARLDALGVDGPRIVGDMRLPEVCHDVVNAAADQLGRLDVVVNAVGVVAFGTADELSVDTMEELFLTNTFAAIALAQAALTRLSEGGVIVQISGVIAEQNLPGMAAYGASKAAVRSFDEALAREARRRKIRVIDARPPHTETGLATRPISGAAPNMPTGLDPAVVARVIADAIDGDATDLPSAAFGG